MMERTERIMHGAALEIAQEIHEDDRDDVERVDARDGSVHIVPDDADRDELEAYAERVVEDYPFAVAEWWPDRLANEINLVVTYYWVAGGQCSKEQLDQYDQFVEERVEADA